MYIFSRFKKTKEKPENGCRNLGFGHNDRNIEKVQT